MTNPRVTVLLGLIREGRASVSEELLPLVYDELLALARRMMQGRTAGNTLQPTALVNEACAKMLGSENKSWENRAHFLAVAAMAMRQVLSNSARAKRAEKRSAPGGRITLSELAEEEQPIDLLGLDDALNKLAAIDERKARLVELRFLGGMTMEESSLVMGVSVPTLEREWRAARAFLHSELTGASRA